MAGFQKAKREKIWAKILLGGPSGSGKSYSMLRLATGLAEKCGGRFAVIDTEAGRIRYYANEFDFDDLQLSEPYTPEKYIEAINMAVEAGYCCLGIDSLSHEWNFCNDIHNKMPGNSWANWAKVTPRHDAFMEKILQSPIHIIATVRGKDAYSQEQKDGKNVVTKQGVGYTQRDNIEYNYSVTFNLSQDTNIATVMKDNTHIFEGRYEKLTESDGKKIYDWANSGEAVAATFVKMESFDTPSKSEVETDSLDYTLQEISNTFKSKISEGIDKTILYDVVKKYHNSMNFLNIKDVEVAKKVLKEIVEVK